MIHYITFSLNAKGPARMKSRSAGPFSFSFPFILLCILCLVLPGCARLPDYAVPQIGEKTITANVVSYRMLTREDFQAASLGFADKEAAQHLQARSSLQIRPTPETKILITRSIHSGIEMYWGNVSNLRFGAYFIPEKSWWNPSAGKKREHYILQHEQIHFALMELTAREINTEINQGKKGLPVTGGTKGEVEDKLHQWLTNSVNKYEKKILAEHTKFDNETSLFYDPKAQKRWWDDVKKRLGE